MAHLLTSEELTGDAYEEVDEDAGDLGLAEDSDTHHLVPERLVRVAQRLQEIDDTDDSSTVSALGRMKLPQMTGQIRDIEQRALELARAEGHEEFRIRALAYNLVHHTPPTKIVTSKLEEPSVSLPQPQTRLGLLGNGADGGADGSSDEGGEESILAEGAEGAMLIDARSDGTEESSAGFLAAAALAAAAAGAVHEAAAPAFSLTHALGGGASGSLASAIACGSCLARELGLGGGSALDGGELGGALGGRRPAGASDLGSSAAAAAAAFDDDDEEAGEQGGGVQGAAAPAEASGSGGSGASKKRALDWDAEEASPSKLVSTPGGSAGGGGGGGEGGGGGRVAFTMRVVPRSCCPSHAGTTTSTTITMQSNGLSEVTARTRPTLPPTLPS